MKGFTLVELLITFAIAGILVILAIPGYQKFMISNRSQAAGTSLVAAIRLARSEAITRGRNIVVCPLNSTQNGCSGSSDWQYGWRVLDTTNGESIRSYPMNLPKYINYCCSKPLQYTAVGTPVELTCSCPKVKISDTASFNDLSYFQINPTNCSNVYVVNIDPTGRPSLFKGVACQ